MTAMVVDSTYIRFQSEQRKGKRGLRTMRNSRSRNGGGLEGVEVRAGAGLLLLLLLLLTALWCYSPFQRIETTGSGREGTAAAALTSKTESLCHGMPTSIAACRWRVGVVDARDKSQERIHPPKAWGPSRAPRPA